MGDLKQAAFQRKPIILMLTAASIVKAVAIIGQALFFVWTIDRVFLEGASFNDVLPQLGGLFGAILLRTLCSYAIGRTGINLAADVKEEFRKKLIQSYATDPLQASLQGQSGRKVSLLLDSVDELDGFFSKYIPQLIQTYILPLALLVVFFVLHWQTAVIILLTAPFIPVFMAIVGKQTKQKADKQVEKLNQFSGTFLDVLQGMTTLRLYGQAERQAQVIKQSSLKFRDATMGVLKSAFLSSLTLEYISMLSIGLIALEISLRLIAFETMSFFTAFFVMVLVPDFFALLKEFGSSFHSARGSVSAAALLAAQLEREKQEVRWGSEPVLHTPPRLSLDEVTFQYGDGFAIQPVVADIPSGSHVAIVGKSGSGKTTLLHLTAGLLPQSSGTVTINGVPRETISEHAWFDELSYISQDPYLFSGTIEENIAIGANRETTHEEVVAAAELAGIAEMIRSLKEGFSTRIGEGGRGLSGGEKQRIALARAFLKQPSVILFDEPTTGLDLKTERVLQESLSKLGENATVITVAHRLHTIRNADQILFLADGHVTAIGNHETLLNEHEPYGNLLAIQQGGASR